MMRHLLTCTILATSLPFGMASAKSITLNTGGSILAAATYIAEYETYDAANSSILFNYEAVGNAAGQNAFLNNDISDLKSGATLTYGKIVGTQVDIGASDVALVAAQLTNPATGSYANSGLDGPLIQIPIFGTAITIPFNETAAPKSGVTLTDTQECGVLSGAIIDWHELIPAIHSGTTIQVVYPSNISQLTFWLTAHLSPICTTSNSNFPIPLPITSLFSSLFPNGVPPANFFGEPNSAALAAKISATPNALGYLTPDYTSIAPSSANTTSLKVACLVNVIDGKCYTPTVTNTETGLSNPGPGAQNPKPPATLTAAMDPLNWVPAIPQPNRGYPIVGYTTMDISSCYASTAAGTAINSFLLDHFQDSAYKSIIENNGFALVSSAATSPYVAAIVDTFLSNQKNDNLNIDNATVCASYQGR